MYDLTILIEEVNYDAEVGNIVNAIVSELENNKLTGEIIISKNSLTNKKYDIPINSKTDSKNMIILSESDVKKYHNLLNYGTLFAKSQNLIFFDIRYSRPPSVIIAIYNELQSGKDLVIGNRRSTGSDTTHRIKKYDCRTLIENTLTGLLFPHISDPTSDIFGIKKDVISIELINNSEKNPLLEILGKANWKKEKEISLGPYKNVKNLNASHRYSFAQYFSQVVSIFIFSIKHRDREGWKEIINVIKFGIVGVSGIIVNMGVLYILSEVFGIPLILSSFVAIELSIINNFIWNDFWTFGHENNQKNSNLARRFISYHIISIGGMVINMGVLVFLTQILGIYYLISNLLGIFVAFIWNFIVNRKTTWRIQPSG